MKPSTFAEISKDFWSDEEFLFESKAEDITIALAEAVHNAGWTKAELAKQLGWKPSRVTRVLTGNSNLTLRTIFEVCRVIGLTFDIRIRPPHADPERQDDDIERLTEIHRRSMDNLAKTEALLHSATTLNRRTWRSAGESTRLAREGREIAIKAA